MKKLVIFDFDGTLVRTALMCYGIHRETDPDLSYADYQEMAHGDFFDAYKKARKEKIMISSEDYYQQYAKRVCDVGMPAEIKAAIHSLSKKYRLCIISHVLSDIIQEHLGREGMKEFFADVLGYDVNPSKTKKLKDILEKYSINPSNAVFITDTLGDVKDANAVGVPAIGVTWGLHDRATLEQGSPAAILDDPKNIIHAVEKILNKDVPPHL